ncbi:MAG: hypothetical protein ACYDGR_08650 [Candidatus Dormibacteria bacterium]
MSEEIRLVVARLLRSRLAMLVFAVSLLVPFVVRLVNHLAPPGIEGALFVLKQVNDSLFVVLWLVVVILPYLVLRDDISDGFVRVGDGEVRSWVFAGARLVVGIALSTAVGLWAFAIATMSVAVPPPANLLQVLTITADHVPFYAISLAATAIVGPLLAPVVATVLVSLGSEVLYDRAASLDFYTPDSPAFRAEQRAGILLPNPLVGRLTGDCLQAESYVLKQLPIRAGHHVWGSEVIDVSSLLDVLHWSVYLVIVSAVFYLAVVRLGVRSARRGRITAVAGPDIQRPV